MLVRQIFLAPVRSRTPRSVELLTEFLREPSMALAVAASSSMRLPGQNAEGTILGTMKDPSGLAVTSASVQLVNQSPDAQRTETADGNGDSDSPRSTWVPMYLSLRLTMPLNTSRFTRRFHGPLLPASEARLRLGKWVRDARIS